MRQIDMTSEAVTRRLRLASELRDLCVALRKAGNRIDADHAEENKENNRIQDEATDRHVV